MTVKADDNDRRMMRSTTTESTTTTSSSSNRRELYTECRENGHLVPMSTTCCHETMDIQFQSALWQTTTANDATTTSIICSDHPAISMDDLMSHIGTYCQKTGDHQGHHLLNCVYDVQQKQQQQSSSSLSACAQQESHRCHVAGGTLVHADVTLECDAFSPTLTLLNHAACMGVSCTHHDVYEYVGATAALDYETVLGTSCRLLAINGQSPKQIQHTDAKKHAMIVMGLVGAILVAVATQAFLRRRRRRSKTSQSSKDDTTTTTKEELSPLRATSLVSSLPDDFNVPDDENDHHASTNDTVRRTHHNAVVTAEFA